MEPVGLVLQGIGALLAFLTCRPTSIAGPGDVAGATLCRAVAERHDPAPPVAPAVATGRSRPESSDPGH